MKQFLGLGLSLFLATSAQAVCPNNLVDFQTAWEQSRQISSENRPAYARFSDFLDIVGDVGSAQAPLSFFYLEGNIFANAQNSLDEASNALTSTPRQTAFKNQLQILKIKLAELNRFGREISLSDFLCLSAGNRNYFLTEDLNPSLKILELDAAVSEGLVDRNAVEQSFKVLAQAEENLWGDTILEGGYALTGHAKALDIQILAQANQVYGYRATISAPALYTDNGCDYNEDTNQWEGDCATGHILVNKTFDANFYEVSIDAYADFED